MKGAAVTFTGGNVVGVSDGFSCASLEAEVDNTTTAVASMHANTRAVRPLYQ